jgi:hypothetical protein
VRDISGGVGACVHSAPRQRGARWRHCARALTGATPPLARVALARVALARVRARALAFSLTSGYYEDGAFGIRLENVMVVREAETAHRFGGKRYLGFEHLTVVPFQRALVDVSLLSASEIAWVDAYHAECERKLAPMLEGSDLQWLRAACEPLA